MCIYNIYCDTHIYIYIIIHIYCLSAEGAKNVSWPWLSPLRGWGGLTMVFTGKFVYIYIYMCERHTECSNPTEPRWA